MDETEQQSLLNGLHTEIERLASVIDAPRHLLPRHQPELNGTWISIAWREANDGDDEDGWYLSLMRNEDGHDWELSEVGAESL
jgi:hypothetical protein